MDILWLTRSPEHPGTRYRVYQFLNPLEDHGISVDCHPFPSSLSDFWEVRPLIDQYDCVIFQKKRIGRVAQWFLHSSDTPFIYDLDDAVMYKSSRHDDQTSWTRMYEFKTMVKGMDAVLAGNQYLMDQARPYCSTIFHLPTVIEMSKYEPRSHYEDDPLLGWIGGNKSLVFLQELSPVLEELGKKYDDLTLKIVCDEAFSLNNVNVEFEEWSEETEAASVRSFQIGLSPLPDDRWSRGKCATKLLQCMASAVPTVSSRVGAHKQICGEDEQYGLLAGSEEEWFEKLDTLLQNPEKRKELGQAGRKRVEDHYSVKAHAPRLAQFLQEMHSE